jgi:hypothetical protein
MSARLFPLALLIGLSACSSPPAAAPPSPAEAKPSAPVAGTVMGPVKPPSTDAELLASARSAAPESISKDATVMTWDMRGLHVGSNGWTCVPDGPSPGVDPMCMDKNGTDWMMALMHGAKPDTSKMGFGYMLMGGSDASNTDPTATAPKDGKWIETGPHVMILNIGDRFAGYPTSADDPSKPYVMWSGTPFAHLMMPVK